MYGHRIGFGGVGFRKPTSRDGGKMADWLIAISHPSKEQYAAQQLEQQGCETYVPLCWRDKPHKGRIVSPRQSPQLVALLNLYFLFKPNGLPVRTALNTRGIRGLVKQAGGEPATVRQRDYERWYEMTSMVADFRQSAAQYVIGQQLKIEEGPFAGTIGRLLEISGSKYKLGLAESGNSLTLTVSKGMVRSATGA